MIIVDTEIPCVKSLIPEVFSDKRGYFFESFNLEKLRNGGINFVPVQVNCAFSQHKGTLRGIHFQDGHYSQAKIVKCIKGAVLDYAIDLRESSPTFLKYVCRELNESNQQQLFIPKGFGHAVISLEDNSLIEYMVDNPYSPKDEKTIIFKDPYLKIVWPFSEGEIIVSEKDASAPQIDKLLYKFEGVL